MYSLVVWTGSSRRKETLSCIFSVFPRQEMSREIWQTWSTAEGSKAAFSSGAALTPSSGGTRHQAPFLLAFNPSSALLSLCLYSLKVLTAFLDPPAYMGLLWLISNNILQIDIWKRMYVCVPSYQIWKEHYEWFDIYYQFRVIYSNFSIYIAYIFELQRKKRVLSQTNRYPCELYSPFEIYITNCFFDFHLQIFL